MIGLGYVLLFLLGYGCSLPDVVANLVPHGKEFAFFVRPLVTHPTEPQIKKPANKLKQKKKKKKN